MKVIRKCFQVSLFLLLIPSGLLAQGIQGEVRDLEGNPVPYAAIFIKELTRGTTCNALGKYSLPLPEGKYSFFFRSLGYTEVIKILDIGEDYLELDVQLPPQTYIIPEVRISASGEDPAYWIMRKTIGLANYHLNEVSNYEAEIYIKGTAILDNLPKAISKRIKANEVEVKEGEAYMLESLNEVSFTAPDNYEMNVLASQNTLPGYTDNVNPMDYVNASLYQEQIEGVISPLARTAFSYYKFSFENTFMEGMHIINKIRVTPKRKSQQLVEGFLFIVEDLWCLHSSDLTLNHMAGTLNLQQLYANVIMDAWMPVSHKIRVNIDIVGVVGSATYVSSLEYHDVELNPNLPEAYFTPVPSSGEDEEPEESEELSREQEKINELLVKEELSNRDAARLAKLIQKETEKEEEKNLEIDLDQTGTTFTIEENAVKNDSLYWKENRPIPLTPEETVTLHTRDSIIALEIPEEEKDTSKVRDSKKVNLGNIVFGRTYYRNRGKIRFQHTGLLDPEQFAYNTVDGIRHAQQFRLDWMPDSLYTLRLNLRAGWNFHRKAPHLQWSSYLLYPALRGKVAFYFDYRSMDFNASSGINPFMNMSYTVFLRQNHLKLYENISASLYNRLDPINGMILTTSVTYSRLNQLENNSLFSFFYRKAPEERFTPNVPGERPATAAELMDQQRILANIQLEYTPARYYIIRNGRKNYRESEWPTFSLSWRKAIPLEDALWSEFSQLGFSIKHGFDLGLLSELNWSLDAGFFPDTSSMHFSDYRHYKSYPLYIGAAGLEGAQVFSDFYHSSTKQYWLKANTTLSASYMLIKLLPWFSQRLWKESLDLLYLYTPETPHYLQLGYRIDNISLLMDLGVYVGFGPDPSGVDPWGFRGVTGRLNFRF